MEYTHTVEAEEYTGDVRAIKKFLGIKDAEFDEDSKTLMIPENLKNPTNVKWIVKVGYFIVKTAEGFVVYQAERFKNEFSINQDKQKVKSDKVDIETAKGLEVKEVFEVPGKKEQSKE